MKTNRLLVSILSLGLGIASLTGLSACGDDVVDDDNNGRAGHGGGGTGGDTGVGGTGGTDGEGGTGEEPCVNTRTDCNECVTREEDPYDACSPYTEGCQPFDNSGRVPRYPDVPRVP